MKQKTRQAAQKRFQRTGSGLLTHRPAAISHLRTHKSPRKKGMLQVANVNVIKLKRMLPGLKGVR